MLKFEAETLFNNSILSRTVVKVWKKKKEWNEDVETNLWEYFQIDDAKKSTSIQSHFSLKIKDIFYHPPSKYIPSKLLIQASL